MKARPPTPEEMEMSGLMATLLKTGQRLEELTAGKVDTVVDRDGRTLLLRGTQEQLKESEETRQTAILNALPAHIALLDATGIIISVNDAWIGFRNAIGIQWLGNRIGLNYLEICDHGRGFGSDQARVAAEGIRSVLHGEKKIFSIEYSCQSPTGQLWFELLVTPLREDRQVGAVVMHINITERKQLEQSVQRNQERLRQLIDGLGPSIFVGLMTPQGILIEANRPALAAAGLEPKDVLGKPFEETYWWAYSPQVQQQLREAIVRAANGEASRYDVRVSGVEGHLIDVDFSLRPVRDANGGVVFLVPSASVITERKRAENALHESEGRYRALVQWSPESIVLTRHKKILFLNPAAVKMTGAKCEQDLIGKSILSIVHPDFRQVVSARLEKNSQEGGVLPLLEEKLLRLDGTVIDVEVQSTSIIFDDQPSTLSSIRDITERKRAAEALQTSLEEFRTLSEAVPQMIWITRPDGWNVYCNQRWMDYTGFTLQESIGDGWVNAYHPEDLQKAWAGWQLAMATASTHSLECRLRRADGAYRWWLVRAVPLQDSTGTIIKWFGSCTDIHDLKMVEEALFVEKENAQVRLNSIGDAVICADISGNINYLNSIAEIITGWSFSEAAGRPVAEVLRIKEARSGVTIASQLDKAIGQNRTEQLPTGGVFVRRDGIEIPVEGSVAPIHDRKGGLAGAVIVVRDVSAARAMELEMVHLAEHDSLTGLPNRLLLNDRVSQAIVLASRHKKKVAILFLDLDGFKHINDSLGHAIGDKLLQSTATRLVGCVRAMDTVSRQGGDEFVVLLSEVEHSEDVATTATRLLRELAEPTSIDGHDLHVTTSIGLSVYPDDGLDAETLIKNADTAMYQAKEGGRQCYQFFKPAMNIRAVERQSTEESLRRALERQEFAVHYQPKVSLSSGEITGAEALIRWTHPTRGPVSPAQFIPVAEDCGLIVPIGNWVLREACKQARLWADSGLPAVTIAVNVSAMEFRQDTFLEGVFAILKETRLDPRSLELELTESILMKRAESAAAVLKELRSRGVKVAVDDFGTGYSSLSYLSKFPIDALKIDQSFVRQITMTPDDTTIVTAIINIGRSMQLRVVAEGVETLQEAEFLRLAHCDEGQGYYFSKPVPSLEFVKLLETGIPRKVLI